MQLAALLLSALLASSAAFTAPRAAGLRRRTVALRSEASGGSADGAADAGGVDESDSLPPHNSVMLVGRMGSDPQPTYFEDGSCVVNISMAVKRRYNPLERKVRNIKFGEEETDWFPLEIWGSNAEYVRKFVKKGMRVGVQGELTVDHWNDKTTGEARERAKVFVRSIDILQSKSESMGGGY